MSESQKIKLGDAIFNSIDDNDFLSELLNNEDFLNDII